MPPGEASGALVVALSVHPDDLTEHKSAVEGACEGWDGTAAISHRTAM
jgi:hypothetical protein